MLTNPFTAVGAGPMLLIKRKVLNAAVDIAAEQLLDTGRPVQESGKILEDVGGPPGRQRDGDRSTRQSG